MHDKMLTPLERYISIDNFKLGKIVAEVFLQCVLQMNCLRE